MAILKPGITLYIVRHGETDWNRAQRYQGQRDIPMNAIGRAQARRHGAALKRVVPPVADYDFIASPLDRAQETMRILRAELGLPVKTFATDHRIAELHYGHWEGHLASDLAETDADSIAAKAANPYGWRPRGGESYSDLAVRVADWLASLDRDTLAVTHGGVSRVARGMVLALPERDVPFLESPQDKILRLTTERMDWV